MDCKMTATFTNLPHFKDRTWYAFGDPFANLCEEACHWWSMAYDLEEWTDSRVVLSRRTDATAKVTITIAPLE